MSTDLLTYPAGATGGPPVEPHRHERKTRLFDGPIIRRTDPEGLRAARCKPSVGVHDQHLAGFAVDHHAAAHGAHPSRAHSHATHPG